jgi:hypothetical protein
MQHQEFIFDVGEVRVRALPLAQMEQSAGRSDLAVFFYGQDGISPLLNETEQHRLRIRESVLAGMLSSVMTLDALSELLRLRDLGKLSADEVRGVKIAVTTQLEAARSDDLVLYTNYAEAISKALLFGHLVRQILPH